VAFAAPAGTPRDVRERFGAEAAKAVRSPELAEKLAALGAVPRPGTPEEFGALLRAEAPRWKEIVARSGAKVE
jgi:tripartite-type tricarboxylate transporter receptor subunit TctC